MEENIIEEGLAYDDVLLIPKYSEVLPKEANLQTKFTRNINLKLPLISAAMDTVTESATAISMAQSGGIGIIHKNLSIEEQSQQVAKVKRSEAGMVTNPITVSPKSLIGDLVSLMKEHGISGFPVVENGTLVGIITGRDIYFEDNYEKPVYEIMTKKVISAPKGTTPKEAAKILHKHRIEKLPVVDDNNLVGLYTVRDIEKSRKFPFASKDKEGKLLVGAAIGPIADYLDRAESLLQSGVDVLVIDTAHGHSKSVINASNTIIKKFKPKYNFDLIAGNIATQEGTKALIDIGVDAVKVGIGPGSICTTRIVVGVGVPQFSAVFNCAEAAKGSGVPVIADGGIKYSGDIVKALAAGANTVMIGSIFAGTDESPGELVIYQGKSYKNYRGMGSISAMQKGSKDRYFQEDIDEASKLVPEGIEGRVAYKGPLANTIFQLIGGVKSAMGYVGVTTIDELQKEVKFVKISNAGLKESHVHNVFVTREAPNYKIEEDY